MKEIFLVMIDGEKIGLQHLNGLQLTDYRISCRSTVATDIFTLSSTNFVSFLISKFLLFSEIFPKLLFCLRVFVQGSPSKKLNYLSPGSQDWRQPTNGVLSVRGGGRMVFGEEKKEKSTGKESSRERCQSGPRRININNWVQL